MTINTVLQVAGVMWLVVIPVGALLFISRRTVSRGDKHEHVALHIAQVVQDSNGSLEERINSRLDAFHMNIQQISAKVAETTVLADQTFRQGEALKAALGSSQHRGRIGEVALSNTLAGIGVRFESQVTAEDNGRPDVVVTLPQNYKLIIDSKFPAVPEGTKQEDVPRVMAEAFRRAVSGLVKRNYTESIENSLPIVILAIPLVGILAEIERFKPGTIAWSINQGVIPCDPTTLHPVIAVISTIDKLWRLPDEWGEIGSILHIASEDQRSLRVKMNEIRDALEKLVPAVRGAMDVVRDGSEHYNRLAYLAGSSLPDVKTVGSKVKVPEPIVETIGEG